MYYTKFRDFGWAGVKDNPYKIKEFCGKFDSCGTHYRLPEKKLGETLKVFQLIPLFQGKS